MKDNGGPAFPIHRPLEDLDGNLRGYKGMTLRDYFAAQTLTVMSNYGIPNSEWIAEYVYKVADAMLLEREK